MDPRIQIWNLLHDGEITAISGEDADPFTMFVSIPYLRRRMLPLGDSFVLTLRGLSKLAYKDSDGVETPLREEMETAAIEILSTDSTQMPVTIATTMGHLTMDYRGIRISLDTGQEVSYAEVEKACKDYWAEWTAKAERNR